jgi:putative RecB family exonuclease
MCRVPRPRLPMDRVVDGTAAPMRQPCPTVMPMTFEQPLPKSLSPSRLSDFQACPRRYQYGSIERIPQPASYASAKGRFIHYVFEHLFLLPAQERTIERAREYVDPAIGAILTEDVRNDLGMDDEMVARLLSETEAIVTTYFSMEDPREVTHEGVELRLGVTVDGTPLFGILDRLDRDDLGNLVIVDYKTGGLPNRNYDAQTFANAELYAALCEAKLGERPTKIRLLYVAQGEAIERGVTEVVVQARRIAAATAWDRINRYYDEGAFPATPSKNSCRFCSYKDRCRASGVAVPA